MSDLRAFVDAFYDSYEQSGYCIEEDQQLPEKKVLEEICVTLAHVSCMREEGRYSRFRVCFLKPDSELLSTYIYAHALLFEEPVPFMERNIHKLAPALNADMSYLMLDISSKPYQAVGIIAAYTTWEKIMTLEIEKGVRMPRIPNLLVNGPGELEACFGEASIVSYRAGECIFFRTDSFTSTLVAEELRNGSHISERDRLKFLYQVIWQAQKHGQQGGHIFIVPSAESCERFATFKYRMYSRFPTDRRPFPENDQSDPSHPFLEGGFQHLNSEGIGRISEKSANKDILTYANLIAKLTFVDGAVILTKDLELIGFGAETFVDRIGKNVEMCFIRDDNKVDKTKRFNDNGMRHRACYTFCNEVEGSVAIILSHDGVIKTCTKKDGKVVVYDNVGLPLL